jgi:hypothetical protein
VAACASTGVSTALSSRGFAACAHVPLPKLGPIDPGSIDAGVEFPWSDFTGAELYNAALLTAQLARHITLSCSTSSYRLPGTAADARGATAHTAQGQRALQLPAGRPTETILVEGEGGAPDVTLTGPGGLTITNNKTAQQGRAVTFRGVSATYFALKSPPPGTWTVTPNPGSVAIGDVLVSDGFNPLILHARLQGSRQSRTISYRIADGGNDQSVQFAERGTFGTRLIGPPLTNTRGTLRFVPASAPGTVRTLIALLRQRGIVHREQTIATFTAAPPPRPGAAGHLHARRGEHTLRISWDRAPHASQYVVRLTGTNGTRLAAYTKRRSVTFDAIRTDERIRIEVRAIGTDGATGPARTLTSRGHTQPPKRHTTGRGRPRR